jgi:hypothetical protein
VKLPDPASFALECCGRAIPIKMIGATAFGAMRGGRRSRRTLRKQFGSRDLSGIRDGCARVFRSRHACRIFKTSARREHRAASPHSKPALDCSRPTRARRRPSPMVFARGPFVVEIGSDSVTTRSATAIR